MVIGKKLAAEHKEMKDDLKWIIDKINVSGLLMMLFEICRDKALHGKDEKDPLLVLRAEQWARTAVAIHNLVEIVRKEDK